MHKKTVFTTFLLVVISLSAIGQKKEEKKLIEFGWDYPKSSFIEGNIDQMQKAPFDGMVFSFDSGIYNAFDSTRLAEASFDYDILAKIKWQKFTDNFLFMRGASYSGPHWLDDDIWNQININLKKVSKALAISKAKGVAFDPEYNYKDPQFNPWIYNPSSYKGYSYEQVGMYVRKRGEQFIRALQTYKPDLKILCFWLLGLVYQQNLHQPLSQTGMALYPFFIQGMLEGKNESAEIIDGNESSYWYQKVEDFVTSGQVIRDKESTLINDTLRQQYKNISIAQSVYFDGLFALLPKFNKGFDAPTKQRWLSDNLYFAYKTTDKYVWFYSERIDWWRNKGTVDISEIIKRVRNKINVEHNQNASIISGQSVVADFRKSEELNYHSFFYRYIRRENLLEINLLQDKIQNIQAFQNSRLILNIENPARQLQINLNGKYSQKGNLILISKSADGITSVAFVN